MGPSGGRGGGRGGGGGSTSTVNVFAAARLLRSKSTGSASPSSAASLGGGGGGGGGEAGRQRVRRGSIWRSAELQRAAANYNPRPTDVTDVQLSVVADELCDLIAENAHEVWAKNRMDKGWSHGLKRDNEKKIHPDLVPYVYLSDQEKEYDLNTAIGTLKVLRKEMGQEVFRV